jgi:hypothetical protein
MSIMTKPSPTASFRDLPTELKDHVFAFIRVKADQQNVCFVNREWNALMVPSFWKVLETTLEPTRSRSLTVLLQPQNRILPNVKHILVSRVKAKNNDLNDSLTATLLSLIAALPKGCLRSFKSFATLPQSCLLHLLQSQQYLETLSTKVFSAEPPGLSHSTSLTQAPWIIPSLGHIKTLTVYVSSLNKPHNDDCRFLAKYARNLETLEIRIHRFV